MQIAVTRADMEEELELQRESKRRRISKRETANFTSSKENDYGAPKLKAQLDGSDESELLDEDTKKEIRCGILALVDPTVNGFVGVLKQRYTDFLVNEVLPDGNVLHLQQLGVPKAKKALNHIDRSKDSLTTANNDVREDSSNRFNGNITDSSTSQEQHQRQQNDSHIEKSENILPADEASLKEIFGDIESQAIISLYRRVLKHPQQKPKDTGSVTSGIISDRGVRTKAHQEIRRIFSSKLDTQTSAENQIVITRAPLIPQQRGGRGNVVPQVKSKLGWEELGGDYLHFTLYKENKDTMEIIYFLASELKVNVKSFQFGGTKDRRGVTVQRASAYRIRAEQLASVGRKLKYGSKVGDFEYHPFGLELGDLSGNEFQITLRDCCFPGAQDKAAGELVELGNSVVLGCMKSFKDNGFINYYGLQRFGSFSTGTDTVGTKLLKLDLKGAIDDILYYTPQALEMAQNPIESGQRMSSDDRARAEAIHIWQTTQNSYRALERLPKKFSAESSIIRNLGFKDRKTGELTRTNDYQGALMSIPRNLRLMYVHAYQSLVWNHAATARWTSFGSQVVEGDLVIIPKTTSVDQVNTQPQLDEEGEPIVLPSAPSSSSPSTHDNAHVDHRTDSESIYERARALSSEEALSGKYSIHDIVLPLPGFDVIYPPNEIGNFYKYFMASEKGGGLDPYDMRRSWKDLSLSGGYRKLLAKPEDVEWTLKRYKHPEDQLVETDLERLNKASGWTKNGSSNEHQEASKNVESNNADEDDKIALLVKMRLGSSTYATMALRELMKQGGTKAYKPDFGGGR